MAALAVGGPVAAAAALRPFLGPLNDADAALVLVVVIVAIASSGRRLAALGAAISAAASFDFFLTQPYESFRITRTADLVTEVLLLVVGVSVGELAARRRQALHRVDQSTDELEHLRALARMLAAGERSDPVIEYACTQLQTMLFLVACEFVRHESGPIAAQITESGEVVLGRAKWPTGELGLPTKHVYLPVRSHGAVHGYFVLTPSSGHPVPRSRLIAAVTIADLVGSGVRLDDIPRASLR